MIRLSLVIVLFMLTTLAFTEARVKPVWKDTAGLLRFYTGKVTMKMDDGTENRMVVTLGTKVMAQKDNRAVIRRKTAYRNLPKEDTEAANADTPAVPADAVTTPLPAGTEYDFLQLPQGKEWQIDETTMKPGKKQDITDAKTVLVDRFDEYGLTVLFPEQGVKVGDKWSLNGYMNCPFFSNNVVVPFTIPYTASYSVDDVTIKDGKTLLVVHSELTSNVKNMQIDVGGWLGKPKGAITDTITAHIAVKSTVLFDVDAGEILSSEFTCTRTLDGTSHDGDTEKALKESAESKGTLTRDYDTAKYMKKQ